MKEEMGNDDEYFKLLHIGFVKASGTVLWCGEFSLKHLKNASSTIHFSLLKQSNCLDH